MSGCRKSQELETAIVRGKVTLDGKPLDKGTISFTPTRGRASAASINSDGSFKLSTYGVDDGAIVGQNRAAVFIGSDTESSDARVTPLIPDRYASPATSGLVYEVKAGQTNDFHVELKSKK
jgi:hypothetical protein